MSIGATAAKCQPPFKGVSRLNGNSGLQTGFSTSVRIE
jgi:hypothetical protein